MENKKIPTVTVSQVNRAVSMLIGSDKRFNDLSVKGEISDFTRHYKTGHLYFSLCDDKAKLKAVMWASEANKLNFSPENGESVVCRGFLTVYEPAGVYQINVVSMAREGSGEQAKELFELVRKLDKEGLFKQKREIPEFPKKIAVITSQGGAALQDIINITTRRCPTVKLAVIPATVQGVNAAGSIVEAFGAAEKSGADTIIFGRGGGSSDDLSAFNDEAVARAIFRSKIPTISAVGHETDTTIADLVADMRAPTPSAAAELATPDLQEVKRKFESLLSGIEYRVKSKISLCEAALNEKSRLINALSPKNKIAEKSRAAEVLFEKITQSVHRKLALCESALDRQIGVISALSPLEVLKRGYSITEKDGKAVLKSSELSIGDKVEIRLGSGFASAEITDIKE
ncbi:MAG: exodeoxyribonuclease VII large subunit [[Eubacterium] saphenum]|nr:exodeoxyribonuclease VII large subunit [[Eubacterium] saphenum]